jgi:hypothetical protein
VNNQFVKEAHYAEREKLLRERKEFEEKLRAAVAAEDSRAIERAQAALDDIDDDIVDLDNRFLHALDVLTPDA